MRQSKLLQVLQTFSKTEHRRFFQYLNTPFFNQRQDVIRLYQGLQGILTEATAEEGLAARLFPAETISPVEFRLQMSYLQKLTDQFLALQHWQNTPVAMESDLVQAYRLRGLDRPFQDSLKQAKISLARQPLRNSDYHKRADILLWEEARFHSLRRPEDGQFLEGLSENADKLWLLQKLRYLCLHTAYRTRFNVQGGLSLRQEAEEILGRSAYANQQPFATWHACLQMLEAPDALEAFSKFKAGILSHGTYFHQEELHDLHLFAINFCIRKVNEGQVTFFHDIMDIYKYGLAKGYLLENGVLSHFTYFNIAAAGLQTQEFEWVEYFIHQYRNDLERRYRDSAFSFNLARLQFAKGNYAQTLELLQHTNYHEPLLNMAAKTMAIKIYYSLDEYEVLTAHLDAFIKYIRRKPGLGYHRHNYLQFARFTQQLMRLNWNDKAEVQHFREKVVSTAALTEREWLLEQI
jgi:hypothetical protein